MSTPPTSNAKKKSKKPKQREATDTPMKYANGVFQQSPSPTDLPKPHSLSNGLLSSTQKPLFANINQAPPINQLSFQKQPFHHSHQNLGSHLLTAQQLSQSQQSLQVRENSLKSQNIMEMLGNSRTRSSTQHDNNTHPEGLSQQPNQTTVDQTAILKSMLGLK